MSEILTLERKAHAGAIRSDGGCGTCTFTMNIDGDITFQSNCTGTCKCPPKPDASAMTPNVAMVLDCVPSTGDDMLPEYESIPTVLQPIDRCPVGCATFRPLAANHLTEVALKAIPIRVSDFPPSEKKVGVISSMMRMSRPGRRRSARSGLGGRSDATEGKAPKCPGCSDGWT